MRDNVVAVLKMIEQKKIENTIRLQKIVTNRRLTLTLIPVGYMRAPETRDEMARVIIKVLEVLHQLHMNGWVHCDLRWENIIFYDGRPLLIDFEFARAINTEGPKNIKIQDKQMKVRTTTPLATPLTTTTTTTTTISPPTVTTSSVNAHAHARRCSAQRTHSAWQATAPSFTLSTPSHSHSHPKP